MGGERTKRIMITINEQGLPGTWSHPEPETRQFTIKLSELGIKDFDAKWVAMDAGGIWCAFTFKPEWNVTESFTWSGNAMIPHWEERIPQKAIDKLNEINNHREPSESLIEVIP